MQTPVTKNIDDLLEKLFTLSPEARQKIRERTKKLSPETILVTMEILQQALDQQNALVLAAAERDPELLPKFSSVMHEAFESAKVQAEEEEHANIENILPS